MGRHRWAEIEALYHAALAKDPHERPAFLRIACAGDVELQDEVESLLGHADSNLPSPLQHADYQAIIKSARLAFKIVPQPFQPGQLIVERFEIIREIGAGGMAVVYEALDRQRNLLVALKAAKAGFQLLTPELEGTLGVRHPNICQVNEIQVAHTDHGAVNFLSMELLKGETLEERLKARGAFSEKEALPIARQICDGLAEAHRSSLIHRDLKTANIFLCPAENGTVRVVITDFGLACAAKKEGEAAGTRGYIAPEILNGERACVSSDIYALGMALYKMVASPGPVSPGGAPTFDHVKDLSPRWAKTIGRCLERDPRKRPGSAQDVIAGLAGKPYYRRWLWL